MSPTAATATAPSITPHAAKTALRMVIGYLLSEYNNVAGDRTNNRRSAGGDRRTK
jgi:hypothetical protein